MKRSLHSFHSTFLAALLLAVAGPIACSDRVPTASRTALGEGEAAFAQGTANATDLGTLGGAESSALGVNNLGQVVGWSHVPSGDRHAFLWTQSGGMRDLGTLGGRRSEAYAINDAGHVVGSSATASGETHAFLWTEAEGTRDLGTLGGIRSEAYAISENGAVVGSSDRLNAATSAFYWAAGVMEDLNTPSSQARGVNHLGQVVGWAGYHPRAVLWTKTGTGWAAEDVGVPSHPDSYAHGINANGEVIGKYRSFTTGDLIAFSWTRAGGVKDLPPLPRGAIARGAYAINDAGQIAGWAFGGKRGIYPTLWEPTTGGWTARALDGPPSANGYVEAISENRQAAGRLARPTGERAFLWELP